MGKTDSSCDSYDEMIQNFSIKVPEYFNFGFDIIDHWAKKGTNSP